MPEKTIKRRLQDCDAALASDDGPIFSTVAKLVDARDPVRAGENTSTTLGQPEISGGRSSSRKTIPPPVFTVRTILVSARISRVIDSPGSSS